MPVNYHYDSYKKIIYGVMSGQLSIDDLTNQIGAIVASGTFPPDSNALWDCRAVDVTTIDMDLLTRIVELRQQTPERGNAKLAILVTEGIAESISKLYEKVSDGLPQKVRTFTSREIAEAWLVNE